MTIVEALNKSAKQVDVFGRWYKVVVQGDWSITETARTIRLNHKGIVRWKHSGRGSFFHLAITCEDHGLDRDGWVPTEMETSHA